MSETKMTDGGPAFPCTGVPETNVYPEPGMSLRDYFAAKAPEPINYWIEVERAAMAARGEGGNRPGLIAKWNYLYANAMLAERAKSP